MDAKSSNLGYFCLKVWFLTISVPYGYNIFMLPKSCGRRVLHRFFISSLTRRREYFPRLSSILISDFTVFKLLLSQDLNKNILLQRSFISTVVLFALTYSGSIFADEVQLSLRNDVHAILENVYLRAFSGSIAQLWKFCL